MSDNQGIFNRGESVMRAQQDYDVYSFIANKPRGAAQRAAAERAQEAEDRLSRFMAGGQEEGVARAAGRFRPLVKMMIKSAAALPVLVLYVGPRKVAQVVKPILQKVLHLMPHLLEGLQKQLQNQLGKLQPGMQIIKKLIEFAAQKMRTTLEAAAKSFNRAKEFIQDKMAASLANWAHFMKGLLPERFSIGIRLGALQLAAEAAKSIAAKMKGLFEAMTRRVANDVKGELKDASALMQRILNPAYQLMQGMQHFLRKIPEGFNSVKALIAAASARGAEALNEFLITPWKRGFEKTKQVVEEAGNKMREIPEAIIPRLQLIATPMINLLAAAQQFAKERKEKFKFNLIRWFGHMNERFQHYAGKVGEVAGRLKEAVQEKVVQWFDSFIVRAWRLFLKGVEKAVDFIVELLEKAVRYVLSKKDIIVHRVKRIFLAFMRGVFFILKQIPVLLYHMIEWAFGRPGVLVLRGLQYIGEFLLRGVRTTVQLVKEVMVELARLGEA